MCRPDEAVFACSIVVQIEILHTRPFVLVSRAIPSNSRSSLRHHVLSVGWLLPKAQHVRIEKVDMFAGGFKWTLNYAIGCSADCFFIHFTFPSHPPSDNSGNSLEQQEKVERKSGKNLILVAGPLLRVILCCYFFVLGLVPKRIQIGMVTPDL